jgi:hypothetical protein
VADQQKPLCAVRGAIRPGAMCGSVIVGMQFCGFAGKCEHQREPSLRNCASSQVSSADATSGVGLADSDTKAPADPYGY